MAKCVCPRYIIGLYKGLMPNGTWATFVTEGEYLDEFREKLEEEASAFNVTI